MNDNESVMTVKQLANELGVSYDTANNAVKRLFPELIKNGVKTRLTEKHIACISKELKNNNAVMDRVTFEVSSKVKNTETELEVIGNALASFERLKNLYIQKENEYKEIIAQKDKIIKEQAHKVEFYDTVTQSTDTIDMKEVAKTLNIKGLGRNNLFEFLREKKILDKNNLPYQMYVSQGYFKIVESHYEYPQGCINVNQKTVVFQKGLDFIRRTIEKEYK